MRKIITQHYTLAHSELFNITSPINKSYADETGFEYISNNERRCPERKIWWEKIAWLNTLLSTLDDGDLVVYEDCDSINISGDLSQALHDGLEYGMVQLRGGLGNNQLLGWYNAGVIIMINSLNVRNFINKVWERNDDTDETSINKELKSMNMTIGNNKNICSLDPKWNCWHNNQKHCDDYYIKSWHGVKYEEKLILIKKYLNL